MINELKFFQNRRVLITGHTGFKGSWLAKIMHIAGAEILGYSLKPDVNSHFSYLKSLQEITNVIGDIRDHDFLVKVITDFRPEVIFHLAAQPLVIESYRDPSTTFSTNIMGSVNLLEACRKCNSLKSLVFVTSDKCYENKEWTWGYRENDRLGGKDPYSSSKAAAELIFASYMSSFANDFKNIGLASVRAGNVIGGGDFSANRIVPDCILNIMNRRKITLRQPRSTRPWQHVLEPLSGYIRLAQRLTVEEYRSYYSGPWNFGPKSTEIRNVRELTEQIISNMGYGEIIEDNQNNQLHEANLLQLNCDKAYNLLGWQPIWDFEKTVKMTTDWYSSVLNSEYADTVTEAQILEYFGADND